jgi:hypothetical protein
MGFVAAPGSRSPVPNPGRSTGHDRVGSRHPRGTPRGLAAAIPLPAHHVERATRPPVDERPQSRKPPARRAPRRELVAVDAFPEPEVAGEFADPGADRTELGHLQRTEVIEQTCALDGS